MRVFLTGATGFIGSHIMSAALCAGFEVRALIRNKEKGSSLDIRGEPIWCSGDLGSLKPCWFEDVDAVIHLASAGVSPQVASWEELLEVNVLGSLRLMEMAAQAGVRRHVVAGSSHEYGRSAYKYDAVPPHAPLAPISSYGGSKAAAFQLLQSYAIENGLEFFYGRIFSAYGKGQYYKNFWPMLYRAAKSGRDFPMTSGKQIGDFIGVEDVAKHFLRGCTRPDVKVATPLVVNVGSGNGITLLQFAELEWKRLGANGSLVPGAIPDRPNQIERLVADTSRL